MLANSLVGRFICLTDRGHFEFNENPRRRMAVVLFLKREAPQRACAVERQTEDNSAGAAPSYAADEKVMKPADMICRRTRRRNQTGQKGGILFLKRTIPKPAMFAEKNEEEEEEEEEKEEEEEEEEETMMDRRGIFAFPIPHSVGGPSPSYQLTMRILPGKKMRKREFSLFRESFRKCQVFSPKTIRSENVIMMQWP